MVWASKIERTECGLYVDKGLPRNFDKILIANRGEIACRVIRTCKQLGIKTVAVYSDADANSMFVKMADEAHHIGPAPSAMSYLRGDYLIELAKEHGAQAIHPGYGFLSENAGFAKACFEAGVEFIGPPVPAITAMGSKSASKAIMLAANVPCVPGYHGDDQDNALLAAEAAKTGYPIMLKAVSGGGGKGMRIVWKPEEFAEALEGCRREALASFKDDRVLLERYIQNPRHVEFQVFADKQGNALHLYERDCSVQRRHQKVLEEAPAPGMTPELRAQMGQSAVDAAKAVGYVGAGTVEFIVDADTNEYFFMEMNTRLQVEHCVSEMIVQKDLVQWQLHVAAGFPLPVRAQEDVTAHGHALELRVYAENPNNNFLPCTGKLTHLSAPALAPDVRVETGVRQGDDVSIFYDPMISKLVTWGPDREQCLRRMLTALEDYQIVGPPTNLQFARRVIEHPAFAEGGVTTKFIATYQDELVPPVTAPAPEVTALAVFSQLLAEQSAAAAAGATEGPWARTAASFRINDDAPARKVALEISGQGTGDKKAVVNMLVREPRHAPAPLGKRPALAVEVSLDGGASFIAVRGGVAADGKIVAHVGDKMLQANAVVDAATNEIHVFSNHGAHHTFRLPVKAYGSSLAAGSGAVAPMAGKIVKVSVKAGDVVAQGQPLVIMEAMKMEHILRASEAGKVKAVLFGTGDFVEGGKPVVVFEEASE
jgi:3-methylcrotonyl-CoA carboxylase alpha subunit